MRADSNIKPFEGQPFSTESVKQFTLLLGTVIAIQTFGDVLGFNPHCHILVTDGCFYAKGMFRVPLLWN
jgi:hypothetical protein